MARPRLPSVLSTLHDLGAAELPRGLDTPSRMALAALQGQARELSRGIVRGAIAHAGTVEGAAAALGCSPRSLYRWLADDPAMRPECVKTDA